MVQPRPALLRYGFAVGSVVLATALTLLFPVIAARTVFILFFVAVALSAWYGGRAPGLLATALSVAATAYFFLPPSFTLAHGLVELLRLSVFIFVALLISTLTAARRRAEAAARRNERWLRTTLRSIGDAVIATDTASRVVFINKIAEQLTGWDEPTARGRELGEVFHIVNEETRAACENPVARALREGKVVGLANHTLLIARDGRELVLEDSAAPIRDEAGVVAGVVLVFRDVTEQLRERRSTEESRARLAALVESSDDAIIGKTLDGIITNWNAAAERLYSYTAAEAVGQPISILIPPDRPDELPQIMARLRRGERIAHFETVRQRKDGARLEMSLTISPIRDQAGHIIGASTIARDVTERKRAEEERDRLLARERTARAAAESANRMKDEFLATISHELRTPLTAILGWARLLQTQGLDEETGQRALEVIERNARAQAQLIEDLLDISRIVTGRFSLDARPVELVPIVGAVLDSARLAAEAKGIELRSHFEARPCVVTGDATRLQQIIWNLVSNAIKFTPRGGRVEVRLTCPEGHAEIAVADNGAGIAPEFLPYVFERFRQADQTTSRLYGGLGLGLAIVRHLVELHGGVVAADSAGEGQGATFTVRLPLAEVRHADFGLRTKATPAEQFAGPNLHSDILRGVRVLVVDDDADTRDYVALLLARHGAAAETAASAPAAFAQYREARPDLLVSDSGMPGVDGYELLRHVRAFEAHNGKGHTPAIALTAYARPEDRAQALAAGYDAYLAKPIDPNQLVAAVSRLVAGTTAVLGE